jgi:uncharacterized protein CbrC (UPF0167 family)
VVHRQLGSPHSVQGRVHRRRWSRWPFGGQSANNGIRAAEFTDDAGLGGPRRGENVPAAVVDEVAHRTPGFSGWQQERWWTHCGDAAAFLGPAGFEEVEAFGSRTIDRLRRDLGWQPGPQWDEFLRALDRQGQPTAYLFRCLKCSEVGGYSVFT